MNENLKKNVEIVQGYFAARKWHPEVLPVECSNKAESLVFRGMITGLPGLYPEYRYFVVCRQDYLYARYKNEFDAIKDLFEVRAAG